MTHQTITEHINKERGYNTGYQAGVKHAWDIIGQAADYYDRQSKIPGYNRDRSSQFQDKKMALLWAQMLVKQGKFTP